MNGELTAWMRLPGDRRVRVKLCVFEEPKIPAPQEPEIARIPHITEWPGIVAKMATLDFERIESQDS